MPPPSAAATPKPSATSSSLPKAAAELLRAEAAIRELASRAASAGQYADVDRLIDWGRTLAHMAASAATPSTAHPLSPSSKFPSPDPTSYPRFAFRAGEIIKTGWSKTDNTTYEHRSPWPVALAAAAAIQRLGASGRDLSSAAILRETLSLLASSTTPAPKIPDYQVYVALGLLRSLSALEEVGRGRYRLTTQPHTPAPALIESWRIQNTLPDAAAR